MARLPAFLKKGDTVLLIATARKISPAEVEPVIALLQRWDLVVETGVNLYKEHHQYAGTDEERAADLQWALDHPSARAILIARGGYGSLRIIDAVNFEKFRTNPKWVVGFSDITVLHSHLFVMGFCSLHAAMPVTFSRHEAATFSVRKLLFNEPLGYSITPHSLNRPGTARGELIGGNLSVLYAISGSASEIDYSGKILFLEDLDEYLYHIDRMMLQLKRGGKLAKLAGIVIGGFSDMKDNSVPFGISAEEIIRDAVKEYSYPVCFNFPSGHIDENMAFYHGHEVSLEVTNDQVTLKYN